MDFLATPVIANTAVLGLVELEETEDDDESDDGELGPEKSPPSLGVELCVLQEGSSLFKSNSPKILFICKKRGTSNAPSCTVALRASICFTSSCPGDLILKDEMSTNSFTL